MLIAPLWIILAVQSKLPHCCCHLKNFQDEIPRFFALENFLGYFNKLMKRCFRSS